MSRCLDTSLCVPIARYGRFLGMGLVASLLVLSPGYAQKTAPPANSNGNNGVGNGANKKGEAGSDRALRLLTLTPIPVSNVNTTGGAMYSFDISFVDQATQ